MRKFQNFAGSGSGTGSRRKPVPQFHFRNRNLRITGGNTIDKGLNPTFDELLDIRLFKNN